VPALKVDGSWAANSIDKEHIMLCKTLIGAFGLLALALPTGDARAWDDAKYPNWKGQWISVNPPLGAARQ